MSDWNDLGHGVSAGFVTNGDDVTIGIIHEHPTPDGSAGLLGGGRCSGVMLLDLPENGSGPVWQIVGGSTDSFDGLTLVPSSLCRSCGHHGWITDGRWVEA